MPFKNEAQRKALYAKAPEVAKKFEKEEKKKSYKKASPAKKEALRKRLMKHAKKED